MKASIEKAKTELENRIFDCTELEEVKEKIQEGVATIPWCGKKECGLAMEDSNRCRNPWNSSGAEKDKKRKMSCLQGRNRNPCVCGKNILNYKNLFVTS